MTSRGLFASSLPCHIALIGFMGSGKTTVGAILAKQIGARFVDTDSRIIDAADGRSIPTIFAEEGEAGFREREAQAVADACTTETPLVIATGGGVVLREENVRCLRDACSVVWLTADVNAVLARAGRDPNRPLLAGAKDVGEMRTRILTLLGERGPHYQAAAHLIVDTTGRHPGAIAREIARKVARRPTADQPTPHNPSTAAAPGEIG